MPSPVFLWEKEPTAGQSHSPTEELQEVRYGEVFLSL